MTNAELITELTYHASIEKRKLLSDAADALEADEHRIAELRAQLPKDGEWLDEQRGRWIYAKCNLCSKVQDVRSNYCPNCGAKMRTVTDCHSLDER